eukprot:TRINITY_DN66558_c4_g2_i2.p3 TRINITY_DN66558_c4_g2~~TRINITY_DN66558_c4_g2_i2.p3  ORF type:complete len:173 (+),score=74.26 TRINITY_DN66558_c4_g2_i2:32-520(+)
MMMMKSSTMAIVAVVAVIAAAAVLAGVAVEAAGENLQWHAELFAKADANHDGVLSKQEFATLHAYMLPSGTYKPALIEATAETNNNINNKQHEPVFVQPMAFLQTQSMLHDPRPSSVITNRGRHPGGCYRVCPQPVVHRNRESFGGPFGPDPYYTYGNNHMY